MTTDQTKMARTRMVRAQLEGRGITDKRVLAAMGSVPREEFVPPEYRDDAYADHPLPINCEQTISQPYIVGRMLEYAQLKGHERVLEIGAGSGYQTALLSLLAAEVCALELEEELWRSARKTLERLGYDRAVDLEHGSGFESWPGGGAFDVILCACAPASLPEVLVRQLKPGGLLVIPVGHQRVVQSLGCFRKGPDGGLVEEAGDPVRFVPMR